MAHEEGTVPTETFIVLKEKLKVAEEEALAIARKYPDPTTPIPQEEKEKILSLFGVL